MFDFASYLVFFYLVPKQNTHSRHHQQQNLTKGDIVGGEDFSKPVFGSLVKGRIILKQDLVFRVKLQLKLNLS